MTDTRARLVATALALLAAGCSGAPHDHRQTGAGNIQEAVARSGETAIHASVVPTLAVGEAVAHSYGIERHARHQLLLVGIRQGAGADAIALAASRIQAHATDLRGVRQQVALRQVRTGEVIDYVGTVRATGPDTLRFDVQVTPEGQPPLRLQFSRDLPPG